MHSSNSIKRLMRRVTRRNMQAHYFLHLVACEAAHSMSMALSPRVAALAFSLTGSFPQPTSGALVPKSHPNTQPLRLILFPLARPAHNQPHSVTPLES
jgi:hypothetical protein